MTLDQWILCCSKAIQSNFRSRNVKVYSDGLRHQKTVRMRRDTVRDWISELRLATNPSTEKLVAQRVFWKSH